MTLITSTLGFFTQLIFQNARIIIVFSSSSLKICTFAILMAMLFYHAEVKLN